MITYSEFVDIDFPYKRQRTSKCYFCGKKLSPKIPRLRSFVLGHHGAFLCYECVLKAKNDISEILDNYNKIIKDNPVYTKLIVAEEL